MTLDRGLEILSLVLGLIAFLAPYKWTSLPRWLTDIVLFVAGGLMGAVISPAVGPLQPVGAKVITDIPAVSAHIALRLHFVNGDVAPIEISRQNVLSWFALWRPPIIAHTVGLSPKQKPMTQDDLIVPKTWMIVVAFEKPINANQILISSAPSGFPSYEVKFVTTTYCVISTNGNIPEGDVEISSKD